MLAIFWCEPSSCGLGRILFERQPFQAFVRQRNREDLRRRACLGQTKILHGASGVSQKVAASGFRCMHPIGASQVPAFKIWTATIRNQMPNRLVECHLALSSIGLAQEQMIPFRTKGRHGLGHRRDSAIGSSQIGVSLVIRS